MRRSEATSRVLLKRSNDAGSARLRRARRVSIRSLALATRPPVPSVGRVARERSEYAYPDPRSPLDRYPSTTSQSTAVTSSNHTCSGYDAGACKPAEATPRMRGCCPDRAGSAAAIASRSNESAHLVQKGPTAAAQPPDLAERRRLRITRCRGRPQVRS